MMSSRRNQTLRSTTALRAVYEKSEFFELIRVIDD
jgi:hypothetical protein